MLNAVFSTYLATDCVRLMDTLVDTLIERQARMQVKSLKNTLKKKRNRCYSTHRLLGYQKCELRNLPSHWLTDRSKRWSTLWLEEKYTQRSKQFNTHCSR